MQTIEPPLVKVTFVEGFGSQVYKGASSVAIYDIHTQGGSTYSPMAMAFTMPFNETAQISVCRLEVLFIGKNMPCLNGSAINDQNVTYSSKYCNLYLYHYHW
jgi:hypothetical protein